jgi:serine/threonine protein kinase
MPHDQGEANAVLQEVHILASLEHPFIVRYYDSFVEMRKLFLVMEYAPNGSLHTVLQQHQRTQRPLAEDTVWRYTLQLLLGLHTIHTVHRVVHRDIKPHNIFLGADDTVKIGDFGVSRMLSGSADMATTLVGSPGYLAPELCSGEPYDEKADIWALGVTMVELCALKHPFGGAGSQVRAAHSISPFSLFRRSRWRRQAHCPHSACPAVLACRRLHPSPTPFHTSPTPPFSFAPSHQPPLACAPTRCTAGCARYEDYRTLGAPHAPLLVLPAALSLARDMHGAQCDEPPERRPAALSAPRPPKG